MSWDRLIGTLHFLRISFTETVVDRLFDDVYDAVDDVAPFFPVAGFQLEWILVRRVFFGRRRFFNVQHFVLVVPVDPKQ